MGQKIMDWGNGIAVTGLSLEFPKCKSIKDFWNILINGRSVLENLPLKRYEQLLHYRTINPSLGNLSDMQASFLETIDTFDNDFFQVSPGDALQMDPSQRKSMEIIWHALEDAAYSEVVQVKLNISKCCEHMVIDRQLQVS